MLKKDKLEKLYEEKLTEMEQKRQELGRMYQERVSFGKPLTDRGILEQNKKCTDISLEVAKLEKMLETPDDECNED